VELDLFISCGSDVNKYRDLGRGTFKLLEDTFLEMAVPLYIRNWDYRTDPPRVVPVGAVAARSLNMVDRSHGLIAIFGSTLPRVTCAEIREMFDRRRRGQRVEIWVFVNPDKKTQEHAGFFEQVKKEFGEEIIYSLYRSPTDFQGMLFRTLIPFIFGRTGPAA